MKANVRLVVLAAANLFTADELFSQGPLTPPGAPAPTMKTLDQVEARTPISSVPFPISSGGSYYLTGNLTVATGDAITITADNVTLDFNGFTITSTHATGSGTAVLLIGVRTNITIANGHVKSGTTYNFGSGTYTPAGFINGIFTGSSNIVRVANFTVSGTASSGIFLNNNASTQVHGCVVNVAGGYGIVALSVSDSTANFCGLDAISGFTVTNCYGAATASGDGIAAATVMNSYGTSFTGRGVGAQMVSNCFGLSVNGDGISSRVTTNSFGQSTSGIGLYADYSVTNSVGQSQSGAYGLQVIGTASFCAGARFNGIALRASVAIGCTTFGGIVDPATTKFLMTP